jgi:hypothetical protein
MSGSIEKLRISPLGDMTKARNDRKLGILMDLPANSIGAAILVNKVIIVVAQPIEGTFESPSLVLVLMTPSC